MFFAFRAFIGLRGGTIVFCFGIGKNTCFHITYRYYRFCFLRFAVCFGFL